MNDAISELQGILQEVQERVMRLDGRICALDEVAEDLRREVQQIGYRLDELERRK